MVYRVETSMVTQSSDSDSSSDRSRKHKRKSRSQKRVGSHSKDYTSSSDDSDVENERSKRRKRPPSRHSDKVGFRFNDSLLKEDIRQVFEQCFSACPQPYSYLIAGEEERQREESGEESRAQGEAAQA